MSTQATSRNRRKRLHGPRRLTALITATLIATTGVAAAQQTHNLIEVYNQAKKSDPGLKQARAQYKAAQEAQPQARAGLLPQINATGGYNWSQQETDYEKTLPSSDQDYTTLTYGLELRQTLFRWGTYKRLDQADARVAQAAARFAAAEQDLMIRVSERYFSVLNAKEQLRVARAQETAIERQLEQARQRFDVGLISNTGVEEAKARYDLARADVIAAENQLESAREALQEYTGIRMTPLATVAEDIPLTRPAPNDLDEWTDKAREQNWQITAARRGAEAAMANVGVQRGGHLPTLDAVGSYGVSERSGDEISVGTTNVDAGTVETTQTQVGLQLRVPIFSGGATSSQVREAQHQYTGAREQLEDVHRSVIRGAADAFRGIESSIQRTKALDQARSSTQSALEAVEAGHEVGTRTVVDVLDAQQAYFQAGQDYQQALHSYLLNTLRLKVAAGTLSPEDLKALNRHLETTAQ